MVENCASNSAKSVSRFLRISGSSALTLSLIHISDLASNAQFYLGEIAYSQGKFQDAVNAYSKVIENYPKSFKLAPAHLKKGLALLELDQKTNAERELRAVVRLFPGTDEERRARAKLKEIGAPVA